MPFIGPDLAVRTADGREVVLLEPLVYVHDDGLVTTVPAGSTSDGGSTPQLAWSLGFTPFGVGWRGFVVHDRLYRKTYLPRDYCDSALLEMLLSLGMPYNEARIIYSAVRVGGGFAFEKDRAEFDSEAAVKSTL
jgi:hypothetical protein